MNRRIQIGWRNAAGELCRITKERLELARAPGDANIREVAESAAARAE